MSRSTQSIPSKAIQPVVPDFASRQKDAGIIQLLCGTQYAYQMLSRWLIGTTILSIAVTILGIVFSWLDLPAVQDVMVYISVATTLILVFAARRQREGRTSLAILLEYIDRRLLQGLRDSAEVPAPDDVALLDVAQDAELFQDVQRVNRWYNEHLSRMPGGLQAIGAQFSNYFYECVTRRHTATIMLAVSSVLVTLGIALGIADDMTFATFLRKVGLPLLPTIVGSLREGLNQLFTANYCSTAMKEIRRDAKSTIEGALTDTEAANRIRDRQTALYYMRKTSPTVFTCTYLRNRMRLEQRLEETLQDFR